MLQRIVGVGRQAGDICVAHPIFSMLVFNDYPASGNCGPVSEAFLNQWYSHDNVFSAVTKKVQYADHGSNFSIKTTLQGCALYILNNEVKRVEPGVFIVINPNSRYGFEIESSVPVHDVSVQYTSDTVAQVADVFQRGGSLDKDSKELQDGGCFSFETLIYADPRFEAMLREISASETASLRKQELKHELLLYYFRNFYFPKATIFSGNVHEKLSTRVEIFRRVNLAKDFLHAHYSSPLELTDVARAACLSESYLICKFSQVFGCTPYRYLRNIRFRQVLHKLNNDNDSIQEIALAVGFESTSSFIRAFREKYQTTPERMRRCIKEKQHQAQEL